MVSLTNLDITIIIFFFALVLFIGIWFARKQQGSDEDFLLSGRKVGLVLFILTNVSTWYGGILGVGEFTYRYGIVSWFTQGFPYYIFAILFAIFFAKKVRAASLFTIPEKLNQHYGKTVSLIAAALIFILVSPAPYLLMVGSLLSMIFNFHLIYGLLIGITLSAIYLYVGGYRADLVTDVFLFFIMFAGFGIILFSAISQFGGYQFLDTNLPETHLRLTGGTSPTFVTVWFLIALWTFTDPGFHQRCYAAKNGNVAVKGLIISVFFWFLFDFLTTSTGLYSRAVTNEIDNPVLAFPMLAEEILGPGLKGIFYAALFATILSTLNSFLFLSATTFSKDFIARMTPDKEKSVYYTKIGLIVASFLSIILAMSFKSVVEIWYSIGSLCIPPIIFLIISSYYEKFAINKKFAIWQMVLSLLAGISWMIIRTGFDPNTTLYQVEPMIVGMAVALGVHLVGMRNRDMRFE